MKSTRSEFAAGHEIGKGVTRTRKDESRNGCQLRLPAPGSALGSCGLKHLVVMIFQIIQTTLKVTSDINFLQTQQRKVDGISELLRRNFDSHAADLRFPDSK